VTSAAFREGVDLATSEIRSGAWSRESAVAYVEALSPFVSGSADLRDFARGYDATIQAFADATLDLGIVASTPALFGVVDGRFTRIGGAS